MSLPPRWSCGARLRDRYGRFLALPSAVVQASDPGGHDAELPAPPTTTATATANTTTTAATAPSPSSSPPSLPSQDCILPEGWSGPFPYFLSARKSGPVYVMPLDGTTINSLADAMEAANADPDSTGITKIPDSLLGEEPSWCLGYGSPLQYHPGRSRCGKWLEGPECWMKGDHDVSQTNVYHRAN